MTPEMTLSLITAVTMGTVIAGMLAALGVAVAMIEEEYDQLLRCLLMVATCSVILVLLWIYLKDLH